MSCRILSLSDQVVEALYSERAGEVFPRVDLVVGCGDLPYSYVEFVLHTLGVPAFFVHGNHDPPEEEVPGGTITGPRGAIDLHRRVVRRRGLVFAGVEGSLRYRPGPFQSRQGEMWGHVLRLMPGLLWHRWRHGRALDVFVSHAPPWGIHDRSDLPHRGIRAFRWLIKTLQPACHLHGHTHTDGPRTAAESHLGRTRVINSFPYRLTIVER